MFCRSCHYDLRRLPEARCPECGTPFNRDNPDTYLQVIPRPNIGRLIVRWAMLVVVAVAAAFVILFHVSTLIMPGGH